MLPHFAFTSTLHSPQPTAPRRRPLKAPKRISLFPLSIRRSLPLSHPHSHSHYTLILETSRVPDFEVPDCILRTMTDIGLRNAETPRML